MAASSAVYLFVYGTLRRSADHPNHALLFPAAWLGSGRAYGRLYDLGAYPGAVFSEAASEVHGEVYRLDDPLTTLARLDTYEGCADADPTPHEYRRLQLVVRLEDGSTLAAWAYTYQRPVAGLTPLPTGDWLLRRSSPPCPSSADG